MLDFFDKIFDLGLIIRAFRKSEWKTDKNSLKLIFIGLPLGLATIGLILYILFPYV